MTSFRSFSTKNDSFKNLHGLHGMWVFDPPVHAHCARRETASFFDRYTPEIHFFCIGSSRDDVQCVGNRFGPRGHANWWQMRSNGRMKRINPNASRACPNKPCSRPDDTTAPGTSGSTKMLDHTCTTAHRAQQVPGKNPQKIWRHSVRKLRTDLH